MDEIELLKKYVIEIIVLPNCNCVTHFDIGLLYIIYLAVIVNGKMAR